MKKKIVFQRQKEKQNQGNRLKITVVFNLLESHRK